MSNFRKFFSIHCHIGQEIEHGSISLFSFLRTKTLSLFIYMSLIFTFYLTSFFSSSLFALCSTQPPYFTLSFLPPFCLSSALYIPFILFFLLIYSAILFYLSFFPFFSSIFFLTLYFISHLSLPTFLFFLVFFYFQHIIPTDSTFLQAPAQSYQSNQTQAIIYSRQCLIQIQNSIILLIAANLTHCLVFYLIIICTFGSEHSVNSQSKILDLQLY